MAKTASLHMRVDPDIKSSVETLYASFGITVSDAVNIFFRKSLMVGGLPFDVVQPRYNAETEAAMQEARDMMAGKVQAKTYTSLDAFYADLDSDEDLNNDDAFDG
ncbi:MAG: type II toxin-antitoxin system RelB/DinJ family antitoxin [Defluviitaleaceae bacterium]|nr:type II toxin-antitoxin system RelB/DinJ family antitoxin [Defluviitaleaceae bacterium]